MNNTCGRTVHTAVMDVGFTVSGLTVLCVVLQSSCFRQARV
jgi:hypothetical protein